MSKDHLPKQKKAHYSQVRGLLSITKASLLSLVKNPATVVFSIIFPLIFILVFGLIGGNGAAISVAVADGINKDNPIYKALEEIDSVDLITNKSADENEKDLEKGSIDAILNIQAIEKEVQVQCIKAPCNPIKVTTYKVDLKTSAASPQNGALITSIINGIGDKVNLAALQQQSGNKENLIQLNSSEVEGRKYKQIDFILPGQLGFSLLNIGVFGTAFVLLSLRETLVLKRFFATPISRRNILLGEGLSRLIFSVFQVSIIIGIGTYLGFTLISGGVTLLQMLGLSTLGLTIFLGFGFIISSVAKSVNTIPPLANLITLPQFLLSGTFFPIEAFPAWLQPISRVLPLTFLNDAMRKVAFEGAIFQDIQWDLFWLVVWGIGVYIVAIRVFKWDN